MIFWQKFFDALVQRAKAEGKLIAIGLITMGVVAFLFACAPITQYPIQLRYVPQEGYTQIKEKPQAKVITVAAFYDKRDMADLHAIGLRTKPNGITIPFTYSGEKPEVMIAQALSQALFQKGYEVRPGTPQWDLNPQTVQQEWGDWVIGGAIEGLSLEAKSSILRTFYECTLKLRVVVADAREKKEMFQETLALSSSYKTVGFRQQTAERMVNKLIAQAIEGTLAGIEKR
jgi:hypothetical protein